MVTRIARLPRSWHLIERYLASHSKNFKNSNYCDRKNCHFGDSGLDRIKR